MDQVLEAQVIRFAIRIHQVGLYLRQCITIEL